MNHAQLLPASHGILYSHLGEYLQHATVTCLCFSPHSAQVWCAASTPAPDVLVPRACLPWLALFHHSRMERLGRKRIEETERNREGRLAPNHSVWVLEVSSTASSSLARSLLAGCLVLMGSLKPVFQEKQIGVHLVLPLCGLWHLLLLASPFITYVVGHHKLQ